MDNVSLDDGPASAFTTEQYKQLVRDCSVIVDITAADVRSIMRHDSLEYDRRKQNGFLGRRLVHTVVLESGQRLLVGDRLHPSRTLRDVADFERQSTPIQVFLLARNQSPNCEATPSFTTDEYTWCGYGVLRH